MRFIVALWALLFSAAVYTGQPASHYEYREPVMTSFHLVVLRNETLPRGVAAQSTWNREKEWCLIEYRQSHYSNECLGHELRHCLEGYWHGKDKVICTSQEQEKHNHD